MKIGIPKEIYPGEKRVATTPEVAKQLIKLGFDVHLETGAGEEANFSDKMYSAAGVNIIKNAKDIWSQSDIILKVRGPENSSGFKSGEVVRINKLGEQIWIFNYKGLLSTPIMIHDNYLIILYSQEIILLSLGTGQKIFEKRCGSREDSLHIIYKQSR